MTETVEVTLHTFLSSQLDRVKCLSSWFDCFVQWKYVLYRELWSPRAGLDAVMKTPCPRQGMNHSPDSNSKIKNAWSNASISQSSSYHSAEISHMETSPRDLTVTIWIIRPHTGNAANDVSEQPASFIV